MAIFIYQARSISGQLSNGKIEARDESDARIKLRAKQLIPVKIAASVEKQKSGSSDFEKAIKNF